MCKGLYNPKVRLPYAPISDGAGEVVAIGQGVSRFKAGDRVVANFMPDWIQGPPGEDTANHRLQRRRQRAHGGAGVILPEHGALAHPDASQF